MPETNSPQPEEPQLRIETLLADDLELALDRFDQFVKLVSSLRNDVVQLQAQRKTAEREWGIGTIEWEASNMETNRVRRSFLALINDFKNELHDFFDLSRPASLLRGVMDQKTIVKEVLAQRLLRGNYEIDDKDENGKEYPDKGLISDGTSSLIYRVNDVFTHRKMVVQVLKISTLTDELREEINKVASLKHRNIIKLLSESSDYFPFYIICEYINGVPLSKALAKTGPRPPSQAVDWLFQLTDALEYMRHKGIRHSNIRPSKIFIDEEIHLVISPFDFVKFGMGSRTMEKFLEDCQYLSPEFLKDENEQFTKQGEPTLQDRQAMQKSNQFSIGLVAYKMLTGKDLFTGKNLREVMMSRETFLNSGPQKRLKKLQNEVPMPELAKIIERMLREDPESRYPNLHEVLTKFRHLSMKKDDNEENILRSSYRRCLANNKAFIRDFYEAFFKDLPSEVRAHFKNRERQYAMLNMAIDVLIDIDKKSEKLKSLLSDERHGGYSEAQFERFLDVLIQTAKNDDCQRWDATVEHTWAQMKEKAMAVIRKKLKNEQPAQ